MPTLTHIGIGGFKSIKELQRLPLRSVNVLVGANGGGKSNLLAFFEVLCKMAAEKLQDHIAGAGGANTLLYYGAKETPALWGSLDFEGKTGSGNYFFSLRSTATDSLFFSEEAVSYPTTRSSNPRREALGSGHRESLLGKESRLKEIHSLLAGIRTFHFHDTSAGAAVRKGAYVGDHQELHSDASNLAAFLRRLKLRSPAHYDTIVRTVRQVAPFFDEFVLDPLPENQDYVRLDWKDRDSEHVFGPHQLSDGTLRAIALVSLLRQPEDELPSLIVLDEPEIGLHPWAVEMVASLIRSASVYRPIIVATQSVSLVNFFEPEDVVVVTRQQCESHFERLDSKDLKAWLDEYSVGDLLEKNVIGGMPSR
jgi:predicted ATPase